MTDFIKKTYNNAEHTRRMTEIDKIISFLQSEDYENSKLSKKQRDLLERYDFCDNQIRTYKTSTQVVKMMMEKYEISKPQAYRDIQNTKRIFGSVAKVEKEYWRKILLDWIIDTIKMAIKDKDLKAKNVAEANLIKLLNLDKEITDLPDFANLQQNIFNITMDPKTLGLPEIVNIDEKIRKFKEKILNATDVEIIDDENKE